MKQKQFSKKFSKNMRIPVVVVVVVVVVTSERSVTIPHCLIKIVVISLEKYLFILHYTSIFVWILYI